MQSTKAQRVKEEVSSNIGAIGRLTALANPPPSPILGNIFEGVLKQNKGQPEYLQAVKEVFETIGPVVEQDPRLVDVLKVLVEPERMIKFRITWYDDANELQVNRGFRVQFSSALGPYKGGLRFHPSVNASVVKFLGFEQVFKNCLTGLPLGGGKGGSDFEPKGKSAAEVRRFCQAFMSELHRHIGADFDVPGGDMGVGEREIGFLFGAYKRASNDFAHGAITGKGISSGGSLVRTKATGYGLVYFAREMLATRGLSFNGTKVAISGAGNVALHACEKVIALGGIPVTLSDSSGFVHDPEGIDSAKLEWVKQLKLVRRGRIAAYADQFLTATFTPASVIPGSDEALREPNGLWTVPDVRIALPCATQNELGDAEAKQLIAGGVTCIAEGANMPCTASAVRQFLGAGVLFAPGKASNAGGVATSGLEMAQNAQRVSWTAEEVDARLEAIMVAIHAKCAETAAHYGCPGNYVAGANIAAFTKVADAMIAQGLA